VEQQKIGYILPLVKRSCGVALKLPFLEPLRKREFEHWR